MNAAEFAKPFESCKLSAYWDINGHVWTVGWGHTGPDVEEGTVWTQAQADAELYHDMADAQLLLLRYSPGLTDPDTLTALTDFVYNLGSGNYRNSTLRSCVNASDWKGARQEIIKWVYSGGVFLPGLELRRMAEQALLPA